MPDLPFGLKHSLVHTEDERSYLYSIVENCSHNHDLFIFQSGTFSTWNVSFQTSFYLCPNKFSVPLFSSFSTCTFSDLQIVLLCLARILAYSSLLHLLGRSLNIFWKLFCVQTLSKENNAESLGYFTLPWYNDAIICTQVCMALRWI